ncbi:MAG: antibiotic biosynthesis monooxygenase [Chloroflexi bacterium HGW-Chloroflexi-9]|nr:MAG: antibiotic biosynthesis monooxygenase [Chloroflexi bacterium HGW-Chloroflexi-9]
MFVAMNRFQVQPGKGEDFERIWRDRETYLDQVPGFLRFALLRGDTGEYISHSTWETRQAFEDWTNSEAFKKGHAGGSLMGILAGPPQIGLFEAVLTQDAGEPSRG